MSDQASYEIKGGAEVASRSLSLRETISNNKRYHLGRYKAETKHADIGLLVTSHHESHPRSQEVPKLLKAQTQVCGIACGLGRYGVTFGLPYRPALTWQPTSSGPSYPKAFARRYIGPIMARDPLRIE